MAAAYLSGTASDPTDLLNQLATFLTGQGWTQDSLATDGTGKRGHFHKGSEYVNFRSHVAENVWPTIQSTASTGISIYMGAGYSGASGWAAQAGGPIIFGGSVTCGATMRLASGAITAFHFFDDGSDNIMVVIERGGSLFTHMGFGRSFTKSGTVTGGPYFFSAIPARDGGSVTITMGDANNHAGAPGALIGRYNQSSGTDLGHACFVRADVDSFTGKWIGCSGASLTANAGYTGKLGNCGMEYNTDQQLLPSDVPSYSRFLLHAASAFNAQSPLLPIRIYAQKDGGGYVFLGELPNVFASGAVVQGGFTAGSIQTVNGKNFMVFPHFGVRKLYP